MKITRHENYRVEVAVEAPYFLKQNAPEEQHKRMLQNCQLTEADIERHVDNAGTEIRFDTTETCSFCGYNWEIDPQTKEPVCCDAAIREFHEQGGLAGLAAQALAQAKNKLEAI